MPFLRRRVFGPLFARRDGLRYVHHLAPLRRELQAVADPAYCEKLQVERTAAIIDHAYENSRFYRTLYDAHGFQPKQFRDLRDLTLVPTFEKSDIPGQQDQILARGHDRRELVPTATGGTTGNSFAFWYDRECFGRRFALTLLANEAYRWRYGDRVAYVWNAHQDLPSKVLDWKQRLKSWLTERRLYLDASRIDESLLAGWVRQIRDARIEIFYGYAHSIRAIAEYCDAESIELPRIRLVVTTAEPLYAADRQLVERTFGCPVRDRYGSREHGLMAQDDAGGHLCYFANSILLENEATPAGAGEILVTDFWNRGFPFIRYRIGDTCDVVPRGDHTSGLPRLGRLTGRQTDFLIAADGGKVSGMSFHEAYIDPDSGVCGTDDFLAIQFVQKAALRIRVRYVPGPTFEPERVLANLTRIVSHLLGDSMELEFEEVAEIPRTASGKYRFTVNEIAAEGSRPPS